MLTPEEISVPNVRVKRDTADLRSVAQHRHLQHRLVDLQLPVRRRVVPSTMKNARGDSAADQVPVTLEEAREPDHDAVGSGRARPTEPNMVSNTTESRR